MGHHHTSFRGKDHQVTLRDLEPWLQQLEDEFGGYCRYDLRVPAPGHGVKPVIELTVEKRGMGPEKSALWVGYEPLTWCDKCIIESACVRLASKALLELSGDRERAERVSQLPLALL